MLEGLWSRREGPFDPSYRKKQRQRGYLLFTLGPCGKKIKMSKSWNYVCHCKELDETNKIRYGITYFQRTVAETFDVKVFSDATHGGYFQGQNRDPIDPPEAFPSILACRESINTINPLKRQLLPLVSEIIYGSAVQWPANPLKI